MPFVLDEIAVPLAAGERPPVWGLNLNVFEQGHADLEPAYSTWSAAAGEVLAGTGAGTHGDGRRESWYLRTSAPQAYEKLEICFCHI